MAPVMRQPKLDELTMLSDLCMRSKAVWGYDDKFMAACREELTLTTDELTTTHVAVAEVSGTVAGVAQVEIDGGEADLLKLFVDPEAMRNGVGRGLFEWASSTARRMGADSLTIEADPGAVPFYRRMGAKDVGVVPSGSIPGRVLPRLCLDLGAAG